MAAPILDLSTFDRPQIRIDKVLYGLRRRGEFSVMARRQLGLLGERIQKLEAEKKPSRKTESAYKAVLQQFVGQVTVDLPPAVLKKLEILQLVAIVTTFFTTLQTPTIAPQSGAKTRRRPIGASSSPN